jgi:hypothetical protein
MTKRRLCLLLMLGTGGLLVAGLGLSFAQPGEASHPETQKLVLENMFVRVWDIRVPPGTFEAKHSHAKFGEVKWAEPVTHEARNVGTTEQHVIRIELK